MVVYILYKKNLLIPDLIFPRLSLYCVLNEIINENVCYFSKDQLELRLQK